MAATIQHIELPKKPRALDTSGNNNHGKIYSGRGLEFDGVSDSLEGVADINTSYGITNSMTVACWVKFNVVGVAQYAWSIFETTSKGFGLLLAADSALGIVNDINDANSQDIYETDIDINTWYRVIVVVDSLELKTYINGVLLGSGTSIPDGFDSFASRLYIGRRGEASGEFYLNGCMSDFQMWDKVWTADDAAYDYANPESLALNASGTALTEGNLKVWYPMQDGHRGQQSYILDGANTGLVSYVVNEDFSTGTSGYTVSTSSSRGAITNPDGILRLTYGPSYSGGNALLGPSLLVIGATYKVKFRAKGTHATDFGSIGNNANVQVSEITNPVLTTDWQDYEFLVTANSTNLRFYQGPYGSAGKILDIDDITVQPINDKHHATTVFFGDEQITEVAKNSTTFGLHNWADYNISGTTVAVSGGKLVVVTDNGSSDEEGIYLAASLVDGNGGAHPLIVGRTYRVSADLQNTAGVTTPSLQFALGGTSSSTFTITASEVTYTKDIVCANASTALFIKHMGSVETGTTTFTVDNISVKEVGVASGWTDADQQLDIAQPALQSYNEMGWFNGEDDRIVCNNGFTPGDNTTVSFWVFINSPDGQTKGLFDCISYSASNFRILRHSTNKIAVQISSASDTQTYYDSRTTVTRGEWMHICATIPKASGVTGRIYINGVGEDYDRATSTTMVAASRDIYFFYGGGLVPNNYTNGCITGVSVHNVALSDSEVLEIYNEGKELDMTTFSGYSDVTGYWRNNGLSTWTDIKGSDDGTHSIAETLLIPRGVDGSRDAQGFIMNKPRNTSCLNLTNTGQQDGYVDLGSTTIVADDAAASFVVWLKPDDVAVDNYFLGTGSDDSIKLNSNTTIVFTANGTERHFDATANAGPSIAAGEWIHVAITRRAADDTIRLYTNGVLRETESALNEPFDFRYVGARNHAEYTFRGQLDGFLYYNDELDDTEVLRNYKATKGSHRN